MSERRTEFGFTLIELMVVVAILGLLAAIVGPDLWSRQQAAQLSKARVDVNQIYDAAMSFRLKKNRWPRSLEELIAGRPPEIHGYKNVPKDPWGNPYAIAFGEDEYDWHIVSHGPDGVEGGEDDIKSNERDG